MVIFIDSFRVLILMNYYDSSTRERGLKGRLYWIIRFFVSSSRGRVWIVYFIELIITTIRPGEGLNGRFCWFFSTFRPRVEGGGGGRRFGHGYNHGENQRTNHWYVDHIQRKTSKLIHFWGKLWIKGWKHCFNHIQIKKHLIQFNFIEYTKMFNLIIRKKKRMYIFF